MNQKATITPTANRMVRIVSQSFLPHQSVSRKKTPTTIEAIFEATMSNPQKTSAAPMRDYFAAQVQFWR